MRGKTIAAENRDITLLGINFLRPELSEPLKCSFTKFFGNGRHKFSTENLETPSLPLFKIFFDTRFFANYRRVPVRSFRIPWDNNASLESCGPFLSGKYFPKSHTLWTTEGFLYEVFPYCETKQFWRKIVIPAPFLFSTLSGISSFLKHRMAPFRNFSVLRDNKMSTKNRDITILNIRNLDTRKKWNTTKGFSFDFLRIVTQKDFERKPWYSLPPPLFLKFFNTRNSWNTVGFVDDVFRSCEAKLIL